MIDVRKIDYSEMKLSPVKAIRHFCVQCMGGSVHEVRACPSEKTCPLYRFRLGKNPNAKREYTDKQRAEMARKFKERLAKAKA